MKLMLSVSALFVCICLPLQASIQLLSFEKGIQATRIGAKTKNIMGQKDSVFRDGLGREVLFRGWNVSGAVKLKSMGFKPFKNVKDARRAFRQLRERTGTNIIRYTISWEGIHPDVDKIDYKYLNDTVLFIKEAIKNKIYVILDYHQDLYSRGLWNKDSKHTGNGAPAWIVPKEIYPKEKCRICFHWGIHNVLNPTIKLAYRNFWNNAPLPTKKGERYAQTEFFWQLKHMLSYIKKHLSPREFSYILGLNPMNEPIHGGYNGVSSKEWYQDKLWSFYFNVKETMEDYGWIGKKVYGEPLVFWNTNAPFVSNKSPAIFDKPLRQGFVFNSHFYDATRMSLGKRSVKNGSYISNYDQIRDHSRKLGIPPFVTEFGMWIENGRVKNQVRMIKANYQAQELSRDGKTNYAKFYAPYVGGTQWHWDIYHNQHREILNGDPTKVITHGDAWNDENFSVITKGGKYTTPDEYIVERAWPRRCQGDILHFHYNDRANDGRKGPLEWASFKFSKRGKEYLKNKRWFFMAWKGRNSLAPTEIYLPPHFKPKNLTLLTSDLTFQGLFPKSEQNFLGQSNQIFLVNDVTHAKEKSGTRLFIFDKGEGESIKFVLAINELKNDKGRKELLNELRAGIKMRLKSGKSPIFFSGGVRPDKAPYISL